MDCPIFSCCLQEGLQQDRDTDSKTPYRSDWGFLLDNEVDISKLSDWQVLESTGLIYKTSDLTRILKLLENSP